MKTYEMPELEIERFDIADVITSNANEGEEGSEVEG